MMVEANMYDKYWAIGKSLKDPDLNDPTTWNGSNYLGKILIKVRDQLN